MSYFFEVKDLLKDNKVCVLFSNLSLTFNKVRDLLYIII